MVQPPFLCSSPLADSFHHQPAMSKIQLCLHNLPMFWVPQYLQLIGEHSFLVLYCVSYPLDWLVSLSCFILPLTVASMLILKFYLFLQCFLSSLSFSSPTMFHQHIVWQATFSIYLLFHLSHLLSICFYPDFRGKLLLSLLLKMDFQSSPEWCRWRAGTGNNWQLLL